MPIEIFHFDFNQNQQDLDSQIKETRKLFNEVKDKEEQSEKMHMEGPARSVNPANDYPNPTSTCAAQKEIKENDLKRTSNAGKEIPKKEPEEATYNEHFTYEADGHIYVFRKMSEDYVMKCPFCRTETKYIIRHIASYSAMINQAEFKAHFKI